MYSEDAYISVGRPGAGSCVVRAKTWPGDEKLIERFSRNYPPGTIIAHKGLRWVIRSGGALEAVAATPALPTTVTPSYVPPSPQVTGPGPQVQQLPVQVEVDEEFFLERTKLHRPYAPVDVKPPVFSEYPTLEGLVRADIHYFTGNASTPLTLSEALARIKELEAKVGLLELHIERLTEYTRTPAPNPSVETPPPVVDVVSTQPATINPGEVWVSKDPRRSTPFTVQSVDEANFYTTAGRSINLSRLHCYRRVS